MTPTHTPAPTQANKLTAAAESLRTVPAELEAALKRCRENPDDYNALQGVIAVLRKLKGISSTASAAGNQLQHQYSSNYAKNYPVPLLLRSVLGDTIRAGQEATSKRNMCLTQRQWCDMDYINVARRSADGYVLSSGVEPTAIDAAVRWLDGDPAWADNLF